MLRQVSGNNNDYNESPLFFENGNHRLFGVLHEPLMDVKKRVKQTDATGIVFCHPFFEEKLIAHRPMVNFARELAKRGHYVLRFDFMGSGDSDGNPEDSTISSCLSDLESAVKFLRETSKVTRVGLLGVRFGASLAALFEAKNKEVDFEVLISPIVKGNIYIEQSLRSNLATQLATYGKVTKNREQLIKELMSGQMINIDGYLLTKELFLQIKDYDLISCVSSFRKSVKSIIIEVSKNDKQATSGELQKLLKACEVKDINISISSIKDHFFWAESKIYVSQTKNIYAKTIEWLEDFDVPTQV
jgi:uncharacterized protein